jgi:hypothetical protein
MILVERIYIFSELHNRYFSSLKIIISVWQPIVGDELIESAEAVEMETMWDVVAMV